MRYSRDGRLSETRSSWELAPPWISCILWCAKNTFLKLQFQRSFQCFAFCSIWNCQASVPIWNLGYILFDCLIRQWNISQVNGVSFCIMTFSLVPSMRISVLSWQKKFQKSFSSSLMKVSGFIAVKSTARSAQWKQHSPIVAQPSVYPFRPARWTITKRKHLGSHTSHNLRSVHALTCWTQRLNTQDKQMRIQAFDHATYVWISNYNRG